MTKQQRRGFSCVLACVATVLLLLGGVEDYGAAQASDDAPPVSIADLIARAQPGDTVVVPAGHYHEQVSIDKPLTLTGAGMPVIDGGGKGDVVRITADHVTLRGFVIQGSAEDVADEPAALRVKGNAATIEDNRMQQVLYGIVLEDSNGHVVRNNRVSSILRFEPERRGHGLYLWYTDGNTIEDNIVEGVKDGIFLGFATHNQVIRNRVSDSRYGIHYMYANDNVFVDNVFTRGVAGAAIMFSRNITFRGNEFSYNRSPASGFGLLFKDVDNLEMTDNLVHHNRLGITMEGVPNEPGSFVTLRHNLIGFNQVALEMATTTGVTFTENTFTGNLEQVATTGGSIEHRNTWAVAGRGNYWDDYEGYDANGDGVGDIPFRYEGAFDDLVRRNEAVRAYSFTPARSALDLAARWFPSFRPDPRVIDPAPLMSPTLRIGEGDEGHRISGLLISALLLAAPLLLLRAVRASSESTF